MAYVANRTSFKPGVSGNPSGRPKGHAELKNKFFQICERHADLLDKVIAEETYHIRTRLMAYQLCLERGLGKAGPEPDDGAPKSTNAEDMSKPELIIAMQESVQKLLEENERLRSQVNEKTKD